MKYNKLIFFNHKLIIIVIPILLGFSATIFAENLFHSSAFISWERASDNELDNMRGGFSLANGVQVDFSFKKQILIDGVETYLMSYQLPMGTSFDTPPGLNDLSQSDSILSTVIQNNVDNRVISTITTIDVGLSGVRQAASIANGQMDFRDLMQY